MGGGRIRELFFGHVKFKFTYLSEAVKSTAGYSDLKLQGEAGLEIKKWEPSA